MDELRTNAAPYSTVEAHAYAEGEAAEHERDESREQEEREICAEIRKHYGEAANFEKVRREEALDDRRFMLGAEKQWNYAVWQQRRSDQRPAVSLNLLPAFKRSIVNEYRSKSINGRVIPGDGGDPKVSEVLEGMIRKIRAECDSKIAYEQALEDTVIGGFGHWRVDTEYADEVSFNQNVTIRPIFDWASVYWDPAAVEWNFSDAKWCQVACEMSKDEFRQRWPNAQDQSFSWANTPYGQDWIRKDIIRVVEEWRVVEEYSWLVEDEYGQTFEQAEMPQGGKFRRKCNRKVVCYISNGHEILETREWAGRYIPIITATGERLRVDGEMHFISLIRDAKDPQRMVNYLASHEMEAASMTPRAPFLAEEDQIREYKDMWINQHLRNFPVLVYKGKSIDGQPVGPPQRVNTEAGIGSISAARQQFMGDMQNIMNIHQARLGATTATQSGIAKQIERQQSDVSTYHFVDNLARAMYWEMRILLDLIPKIYDAPRMVQILKPNRKEALIWINKGGGDALGHVFDLTEAGGKYEVAIDVSSDFKTTRQETLNMLALLYQTNPAAFNMSADLFCENLDTPLALDLAERFKALLPPQLQQLEMQGLPPAIAEDVQRLLMENRQLKAAYAQAADARGLEMAKLASNEKVAHLNMQANVMKALIDGQSKEAIHGFKAQAEEILSRRDTRESE